MSEAVISEPLTPRQCQSELFDIIAAMVTTTPVMLDEPPIMATVRMLHSASVLISVSGRNGLGDEFLSTARADFERDKTMVMSDPEQFVTWLDDLSARFVREVKRRNCEPS